MKGCPKSGLYWLEEGFVGHHQLPWSLGYNVSTGYWKLWIITDLLYHQRGCGLMNTVQCPTHWGLAGGRWGSWWGVGSGRTTSSVIIQHYNFQYTIFVETNAERHHVCEVYCNHSVPSALTTTPKNPGQNTRVGNMLRVEIMMKRKLLFSASMYWRGGLHSRLIYNRTLYAKKIVLPYTASLGFYSPASFKTPTTQWPKTVTPTTMSPALTNSNPLPLTLSV